VRPRDDSKIRVRSAAMISASAVFCTHEVRHLFGTRRATGLLAGPKAFVPRRMTCPAPHWIPQTYRDREQRGEAYAGPKCQFGGFSKHLCAEGASPKQLLFFAAPPTSRAQGHSCSSRQASLDRVAEVARRVSYTSGAD